jgi:excisionase family DNA binding protein
MGLSIVESKVKVNNSMFYLLRGLEMTKLLTVSEAAEALGLKAPTIRAWLAKRKLACVRCGRAVRIPAEVIAEFIERNTVPAQERRSGR